LTVGIALLTKFFHLKPRKSESHGNIWEHIQAYRTAQCPVEKWRGPFPSLGVSK
jgi:hypothetical protein